MEHNLGHCLVTGAAGFVGSHMVDLLVSKGIKVRASDRFSDRPADLPEEVEYLPADLTQPEGLAAICKGIDVIFHPASIFNFSTPADVMERVNVQGTDNICRAACDCGVKRMILWSTMMMFGDSMRRQTPITEDTPRVTNSIYASSKIRQEDVALRYSHSGELPVTVIRPAIVYGPRSVYGLADIYIKAKHLPLIPVPPAMKTRICLVHVTDLVRAAYHLAVLDQAVGECYNIVDDYSHIPVRDMLMLAAVVLQKMPVPLPMPLPVVRWFVKALADFTHAHPWMRVGGRPIMEKDFVALVYMDGYASNAKLRATGFDFTYPDWRSGVIDCAGWYRARGLW